MAKKSGKKGKKKGKSSASSKKSDNSKPITVDFDENSPEAVKKRLYWKEIHTQALHLDMNQQFHRYYEFSYYINIPNDVYKLPIGIKDAADDKGKKGKKKKKK